MLPYLIVFSICIFLNSLKLKSNKVPLFLSCLVLSLLAGFRDMGVGTDTMTYSENYFITGRYIKDISDIGIVGEGYDKGYLMLNRIGSFLSNRLWIVFFLTELLITGFTFGAFYRLRKYFRASSVMFTLVFLLLIYNYTYNAMRQMCAVAIAFYAFSYLWERKWLPYIGWTLLAVTFHSSAAVSLLIPIIYAVVALENTNVRKYLIYIFMALMVISVYYYYDLLLLLGNMGMFKEAYMERYGENTIYEVGRIPNTFIAITILIYYIIYLTYKKTYILKSSDLLFHFTIHTFYMFAICLSLYSLFLYRIGLYFYLISIFFFSVELTSRKIPYMWRWSAICIVMFYWFFNYVIKGNGETIPYTSKILGIY